MLRTLRAVARIAGIAAATLGVFIAFVSGRAVMRDPATLRRWRTTCTRAWGRLCAAAGGMTLRREGVPPTAPYFLVFNHLSYADAVLLMAYLEHPMVCARHDFADWPVLGYIARQIGAIWVHRKDFSAMPGVIHEMDAALASGYGVVMAPEATTTNGDRVYPFHSTLLEPAARLGVPVHYCSLQFSTPAGEPAARDIVHWWQDVSFGAHAWKLLHANRVDAVIHFGPSPVGAGSRKELARKLHDAVSAIYQPV